MSLVALRCPHCARALPAHEGQRLFACPDGHGCFRVGRDRLWPLEFGLIRPSVELPADREIVLLPIWLLEIDPQFAWRGQLPAQIRVPAIGLQRLPMVIDFARNLTRNPQPWSPLDARELAFDGASIEAADAMEIGELVALGLQPGWPPDDLAAELEIPFAAARLVLLPASRFAQRLECLVGGVSCPAVLFEDLPLLDRREQLRRCLAPSLG